MTRSVGTSRISTLTLPVYFPSHSHPMDILASEHSRSFRLAKSKGKNLALREHYKFKNYLALKRFMKFHTLGLRWHHSVVFGLWPTGPVLCDERRSESYTEPQKHCPVPRPAVGGKFDSKTTIDLELFKSKKKIDDDDGRRCWFRMTWGPGGHVAVEGNRSRILKATNWKCTRISISESQRAIIFILIKTFWIFRISSAVMRVELNSLFRSNYSRPSPRVRVRLLLIRTHRVQRLAPSTPHQRRRQSAKQKHLAW